MQREKQLLEKKAVTIAVYNQKGGVGKTTTAFHLAVGLARANKKVLIVDTDVQGNLTQNCGFIDKSLLKNSLAHLLQSVLNNIDEDKDELITLPTEEILKQTLELDGELTGISLIPMGSDKKMNKIIKCISVVAEDNEEYFIKTGLRSVLNEFDVIIIDCPSSFGISTTNALVAADYVLVPMKPEFFSGKGIEGLVGIFNDIRKKFNPKLKLAGILPTMVECQYKSHQEVLGEIQAECDGKIKIFNSIIPKSSKIGQKQSEGSHILDEKRNKVADGYNNFVLEILEIIENWGFCK